MDAFDDAFGAEVDPAAEFLAKEQEELADLGEDLGFAAPPAQVGSQDADPLPHPSEFLAKEQEELADLGGRSGLCCSPRPGRITGCRPPPPPLRVPG
jgi:hypothetical protein